MIQLAPAVAAFQEGAANPDNWGVALERMAKVLHSDAATLTLSPLSHGWCEDRRLGGHNPREQCTPNAFKNYARCSAGIGDLVLDYLNKPMKDPRYDRLIGIQTEGFLPDHAGFSAADIANNDYYQAFLKPRGFMWHAVARLDGDLYITLMRELKHGSYDDVLLNELNSTLPWLRATSRAVNLTWRANFRGRLSAFESLGRGALLLDRQGKVLELNSSVELGDGLDIAKGRLRASTSVADASLQALVASLVSGNSTALPPTLRVIVPRRTANRPWVLDGISTPDALSSLHSEGAGILVVTNLDKTSVLPTKLLIDLFRLTPTEARLAVQLCSGSSLQCAAQDLSMSLGYARQRLKAIFQKTCTGRQSELMLLLARLSA